MYLHYTKGVVFIKVENVKVYGIEDSFRASKFPMLSDVDKATDEYTKRIKLLANCTQGTGHDNFLNGIIVQLDLTLSNKCWVEMQRYHFIDFVSSQSTMHKITSFDLDTVYNKYVDKRIIDIMKGKVETYDALKQAGLPNEAISEELKERYLEILYSNPAGFQLTARMTTNYRQLKTIYLQRKSHRLPEWRDFCGFIETLPYSELITEVHEGI